MFGMPRKSWFTLLLASVVSLSAGGAASGQDDSLFVPAESWSVFTAGVEYLGTTRDAKIQNPGAFIVGPDANLANFGAADFDYQSGVRAFLGLSSEGVKIEGIFSDYGVWNYNNSGNLTDGLAFDEGLGGPWTGANSIDLTTPFIGLHSAAAAGLGGDADESEGLGPNTTFPGDGLPSYEVFYRSRLQTFELNLLSEDPTAHFQFGIGYRNLQLDETAGVAYSGTFRAEDFVAPNNGLSHIALTTAGGLSFLGGTANGFEDEVGNASGLADTVTLLSEARTSNDLNGIQGIFKEEIMYWRGWTIDGIVKAGVYHNQATGSVSERHSGVDPASGGDTSVYGRSLTDSQSTLAFVGGLGLQSNLPLSNHWSFVTGYEGIFVHGVAIAPNQYDAVNSGVYNIDTHGRILAHGGNAGLQFSY